MSSKRTLEVIRDRREVRLDGVPISMGARAFDVLAMLADQEGEVVSKQTLLEDVWGGLNVEEGNLTVQISTLRRALGTDMIRTVAGVGYQLAKDSTHAVQGGPDLPDLPSLAVLPFANLTGNSDRDYFVDGIVNDVIGALSRITGIFVIAATSSFRYKGQSVDVAKVGAELGVRYILEGAIQQAGDDLRVSVQLVEAETGRTIWTERVLGTTQDPFDLQDRLSAQVAGALEPKQIYAEAERVASKPTENAKAYDLLLQAQAALISVPTFEVFEESVALIDRAIDLDPNFDLAKSWKVRAYMVARSSRLISFERSLEVKELAAQLIQPDQFDPHVIVFAAVAHGFFATDREEAAQAARRAILLNPNSGLVLSAAGWPLVYVGDYEAADRSFEQALRIDPVGPDSSLTRAGLGSSKMFQGQLDEAIEILETARKQKPNFGSVIQWLVMAYWAAGEKDKAMAAAEDLKDLVPNLGLTMTMKSTPHKRPEQIAMLKAAFEGVGLPT